MTQAPGRPQKKTPRPFWRLMASSRELWWQMAGAGGLGFLTVGSSVALMATGAWLISAAALQPNIAELQVAIVGVRFFGIARGVFRYAERLLSHNVTFELLKRLRVWFYARLEPLAPAGLVDQYDSGDLLSRVVSDVETLEDFFVRVLAPPLTAFFTIIGMLIFVGLYTPALALTLLGFFLLGGLGVPFLAWLLGRRAGEQVVRSRAALNAALVDGIQGVGDLNAFNAAGRKTDQVKHLSHNLVRSQQALTRIDALNNSLITLLTGSAMIAVLAVAIPHVEGIHLGAVALGVVASFEAILPLPAAARHLGSTMEAARRLYEVTDAEPTVGDPPFPADRPAHFDLKFEGVSFRYGQEGPPALNRVSFSLEQGQKLAIVGPSGAGKSTIVNLLLRFWEYDTGQIMIGGQDIHHYNQEDLRRWISVVSQRTHLFNASIRENLLIANPLATEEQIVEAARRAQIDRFIRSLPEGYDTWAGEQGVRFSGGERQRIAIARALLKDAPIIILDEVTANLDAITAQAVIQAIQAVTEGRTTLIITHRLTDLHLVDQVVVLRGGQIVQHGTHDSLKNHQGLYRQMLDEWQQSTDRLTARQSD